MSLTYGRNGNTQSQSTARTGANVSVPGVPMPASGPASSMSQDERERLRARFGDRTFWQNSDDRRNALARANLPSGNPFNPRPQQATQSGQGNVAPRQDQGQADWNDDEGYHSDDGHAANAPSLQITHHVSQSAPQSNNSNNRS